VADIIVGVDGSEGSVDALRWALEEARVRSATVVAVVAWQPYAVGAAPLGPMVLDLREVEEEARQLLSRSIDAAREAVAAPDVRVEGELLEGSAASVLVSRSKGADMLIVGSRGLGGFKGLLLGSVSSQCIHHATCPVVIVPPKPER
jgi:nucleotide-binding universal stress UspA family protein